MQEILQESKQTQALLLVESREQIISDFVECSFLNEELRKKKEVKN
jgi:hypothetical protein